MCAYIFSRFKNIHLLMSHFISNLLINIENSLLSIVDYDEIDSLTIQRINDINFTRIFENQKLPKINTLKILSCWNITDVHVFSDVTTLILQHVKINDYSCFTKLHTLALFNICQTTESKRINLSSLIHLTKLITIDNYICDLSSNINLKHLEYHANDYFPVEIFNLSNLEYIDLRYDIDEKRKFEYNFTQSNLTTLKLHQTFKNEGTICLKINSLNKLINLSLININCENYNSIIDDGTSLKYFNWINSKVCHQTNNIDLSKLINLEKLKLNNVQNTQTINICNLTKLEQIRLDNTNNVSFLNLDELKHIQLNNSLNNCNILELSKLNKLHTIELRDFHRFDLFSNNESVKTVVFYNYDKKYSLNMFKSVNKMMFIGCSVLFDVSKCINLKHLMIDSSKLKEIFYMCLHRHISKVLIDPITYKEEDIDICDRIFAKHKIMN